MNFERFEKANITEEEPSPVFEEDVISETKQHHQSVSEAKVVTEDDAKTIDSLSKKLEQLECSPIYRQYSRGEIPTLDTFSTAGAYAVEKLDKWIQEEEHSGATPVEIEKETLLRDLLQGREESIRMDIQMYIDTVVRFHNIKLQARVRDMTKQFEQIDHARKRRHDALIESLSIFSRSIVEASQTGAFDEKSIIDWSPGTPLTEEDKGHPIIFSGNVLRDRDYIKDWALASYFDEKMKDLRKMQDEKQQNK